VIDKQGLDKIVAVYELRDPRDESCSPRYVGITAKPLEVRVKEHITHNKKVNYKNNWIKSLVKEGITPTIHLIEVVTGWGYACEVEKYYIKEFKEQGYRLTNSTEGGDGIPGYIFDSEVLKNLRSKIDNTTKVKESNSDSGVSLVKNTGKWEAYIWVNNIKLCAGTYSFKEDAENARKFIIKEKHKMLTPDISELREIVKEYTKKEWCRKLLLKPPSIVFVKKTNRWKATTFHIGGKHKFICECASKEEAIMKYHLGVQKHVEDILRDYKC